MMLHRTLCPAYRARPGGPGQIWPGRLPGALMQTTTCPSTCLSAGRRASGCPVTGPWAIVGRHTRTQAAVLPIVATGRRLKVCWPAARHQLVRVETGRPPTTFNGWPRRYVPKWSAWMAAMAVWPQQLAMSLWSWRSCADVDVPVPSGPNAPRCLRLPCTHDAAACRRARIYAESPGSRRHGQQGASHFISRWTMTGSVSAAARRGLTRVPGPCLDRDTEKPPLFVGAARSARSCRQPARRRTGYLKYADARAAGCTACQRCPAAGPQARDPGPARKVRVRRCVWWRRSAQRLAAKPQRTPPKPPIFVRPWSKMAPPCAPSMPGLKRPWRVVSV